MRFLLRSFVFLDAVSAVFMAMQLWQIAQHYNELTKPSEKLAAVFMFPMFVLVIVGAIGLFLGKKYGFVLYYVQFPLRLFLWVFTLGFITLLPEAFSQFGDEWFPILLKVCIVFEFLRLYFTVRTQLRLVGHNAKQ